MIVFHNPGLIEANAFRLMGASVKSENAFGRFGTGLKYAVATVLRGGGSIRVHSGERTFNFALEPSELGGKTFDEVVLIEDMGDLPDTTTPLGFTSALGRDWEPWMAVRELGCNARDEGGDFGLIDPATLNPPRVYTMFLVSWPKVEAEWDAVLASTFAPGGEVLLEEAGVRVLPGPSEYLYHRGVRVWKLPKPSVFTYDITAPVDLTEDRTVKYGFCVVADVRNMILQTEDRGIIAAAVTANKDTWERGFDWSGQEWSAVPPGATWLDEVAALREKRVSDYNAPELSNSASDVMIKHRAFKKVHHSFSWSTFEGEARALNYASDILNDLGMGLEMGGDDAIKVYITKMLPGDALSAINGGRVFLAERLLEERTSTIVRELVRRQLELKSGGDHDTLLDFAVEKLFDLALKQDSSLCRDWALAKEETEAGVSDTPIKDAVEAAEPEVELLYEPIHPDNRQGKTEKQAALAQGYGMGDIKVAQITGEYPPRDHLKERPKRD